MQTQATLRQATGAQIETIEANAYNDLARQMEAQGIHLTHDQADQIGDLGLDWLTRRLGLTVEADAHGVTFTPASEASRYVGDHH